VLTSVVATALVWSAAGRLLRPIRAMTTTARRISMDNLDERLGLSGPDDELKEVADTFDSMLDRLAETVRGQRAFIAHVSHELRTPLSIAQTALDLHVAENEPGATAQSERYGAEAARQAIGRADRILDGLLVLAHAQRPSPTDDEQIDLADVAAEVAATTRQAADRRGFEVCLDLATAPIRGTTALVDRMVANLLDNAIRHNHDQGVRTLDVRTWSTPHTARLTVTNTCPAISPTVADRLFEPFFRSVLTRPPTVTDAGGGTGLGLAIVKAIAERHAGSAGAAPTTESLEIHITLPRGTADDHRGAPTPSTDAPTTVTEDPAWDRPSDGQPEGSCRTVVP
jgi:signal transduction histidine kinase